MRRNFLLAATGLPLWLLPYGAAAEDRPPRPDEKATYAIVWENDVLFGDTDRNYTNGVRASYLSGTHSFDGPAGWVAKNILGANDNAVVRRGFALGHSIYTPNDIRVSEPLPDQHPYAGWLYGEYNAVVEQSDALDQFAIQIGIVGPSAQGEFVQNEVHDLIGSQEARGWDNQIDDEPGIVLSYDKRFRALASLGDEYLGVDLTPNIGFSAGNVQTNARSGITLRVGQDLSNDFGPPRIRPSLGGSSYFNPIDDFSWYLFAGVEGRAVAHDIFLDGSLFRDDDPDVSSKIFVADFQGGAVIQFYDTQLAITYVRRTDEFDQQSTPQEFGAVSLSFKY